MARGSICLLLAAIPAIAVLSPPAVSFGQDSAPVTLASHRAIYDLKLAQSRGRRSLASVTGRIVYDFAGSACEGYALQFRQVTQLDSGEGKEAVSDLRSATWEDGDGKAYRFTFQNYVGQRLVDSVDGRAERTAEALNVSLTKPSSKQFHGKADIVFPTEHMRKIIEAARGGKTLLELPVYDGSETGEKLYSTLTVIGHEIPADERKPTDAAAGQTALDGLRRWPVTISYFDKAKPEGEQMPVYSISFELYDNGISRGLSLDYGDFTVSGEMTTLEIRNAQPCK